MLKFTKRNRKWWFNRRFNFLLLLNTWHVQDRNMTTSINCIVLLISLLPLSFLVQHAALSEYRPILPNRSQSRNFSMADVKLTLIPIIFIVLRIWSTVRFILLLVDSPVRQNPVLVTLHVSIGDYK